MGFSHEAQLIALPLTTYLFPPSFFPMVTSASLSHKKFKVNQPLENKDIFNLMSYNK
jgi:hypothetical protein